MVSIVDRNVKEPVVKRQRKSKVQSNGRSVTMPPPKQNLSLEEQKKLEKVMRQYKAAVEKYNKYPYRTEGFSHTRCAIAVIKAFDLNIHERVILEIFDKQTQIYGKELKPANKLNEKVENEYNKIRPSPQCLHPDVISMQEFVPAYKQLQALKEISKDIPNSETNCLRAVATCMEIKARGDKSKPLDTSTLRRYYVEYLKENELESEILREDIKEEFFRLMKEKAITISDDEIQQIKEPLRQYKALQNLFKKEGTEGGYSLRRCQKAIIQAYQHDRLMSTMNIQRYFERYEEFYGEKCPSEEMPEQKAIDAYNALEIKSNKAEGVQEMQKPLRQYKALMNLFGKDPKNDYSKKRCQQAIINAYQVKRLNSTTQVGKYLDKYKEFYGEECPDDEVPEQAAIDAYNELNSKSIKANETLEAKKPLRQYKALMNLFGKDPKDDYSKKRCQQAIINAYQVKRLNSTKKVAADLKKYEKLFGEKCPDDEVPEQAAIDAYNQLKLGSSLKRKIESS